jgi:hypothetical protein
MCNLLSVGQLIEKGFSVIMENNLLTLYDSNQKIIMKSEKGSNRTFKVNVETVEA